MKRLIMIDLVAGTLLHVGRHSTTGCVTISMTRSPSETVSCRWHFHTNNHYESKISNNSGINSSSGNSTRNSSGSSVRCIEHGCGAGTEWLGKLMRHREHDMRLLALRILETREAYFDTAFDFEEVKEATLLAIKNVCLAYTTKHKHKHASANANERRRVADGKMLSLLLRERKRGPLLGK